MTRLLPHALATAIIAPLAITPARAADSRQDRQLHLQPEKMTVKAGTTVTWTNEDDIPHTVTSTTRAFKSRALDTDQKYSFTFTTPGTTVFLRLASAHDRDNRGGGGDRQQRAAMTAQNCTILAMAAGDGGVDKAQRFRAVALPYLDDVYTLARYLLRNAADAEDAAQECYLRAFRHFDTFRGGPIKPWLLAILRNVCRAEYARRGTLARLTGESLRLPSKMRKGCGARVMPRRKPRC